MLLSALSLTYLGTVLLYAASSASPPGAKRPFREWESAQSLRAIGSFILGGGLVVALFAGPIAEGLLIWGSMAMVSCSFVAVAGPFVGPLLPATGLLALAAALLGAWM